MSSPQQLFFSRIEVQKHPNRSIGRNSRYMLQSSPTKTDDDGSGGYWEWRSTHRRESCFYAFGLIFCPRITIICMGLFDKPLLIRLVTSPPPQASCLTSVSPTAARAVNWVLRLHPIVGYPAGAPYAKLACAVFPQLTAAWVAASQPNWSANFWVTWMVVFASILHSPVDFRFLQRCAHYTSWLLRDSIGGSSYDGGGEACDVPAAAGNDGQHAGDNDNSQHIVANVGTPAVRGARAVGSDRENRRLFSRSFRFGTTGGIVASSMDAAAAAATASEDRVGRLRGWRRVVAEAWEELIQQQETWAICFATVLLVLSFVPWWFFGIGLVPWIAYDMFLSMPLVASGAIVLFNPVFRRGNIFWAQPPLSYNHHPKVQLQRVCF
jgi:hypothetical protein